MPLLAELRESVLRRSTTRMPKWNFRVQPDIVMQIQPHTDARTKANDGGSWFDCLAVIRDDVTGAMLKDFPQDSWKLKFKVTIRPSGWFFHVYSVGFYNGQPQDDCLLVRDRLVALMPVAFERLRPSMMLRPSCLMCGKGLTDPVSMARWFGPECAGTSSTAIPYNFILEAV